MRVDRIGLGLCSFGIAASLSVASSAQTGNAASSGDARPAMAQAVVWQKQPRARELGFYEPERAQRMAQDGEASIRCGLVAAGALTNCAVAAENPAGFGFGTAALKLVPFFKAATAAQDRTVVISVQWRSRGGSTLSTEVAPAAD